MIRKLIKNLDGYLIVLMIMGGGIFVYFAQRHGLLFTSIMAVVSLTAFWVYVKLMRHVPWEMWWWR